MVVQQELSEADISESLVNRIVNQDSTAESEMVQRYQHGLAAMLYNRSRDKALSEDIAQETWVIVIQKVRANQLRDASKLAAFIVQIGKNQLIMNYRKVNRHQHVSDDHIIHLVNDSPSPEQGLFNKQLGMTVGSLLASMSKNRDAELLRRFYLIGDSKKTLCDAYDLTAAHFDRVLYRARNRFKHLWQESQAVEE